MKETENRSTQNPYGIFVYRFNWQENQDSCVITFSDVEVVWADVLTWQVNSIACCSVQGHLLCI